MSINNKLGILFFVLLIFTDASKAQDAEGTASNCTRAKPLPLFKKKDVVKRSFKLIKNKEYPFEYTGVESVKLINGDTLTIKNYGCDNFSLSFRFKTKRVSGNLNQVRLWFKNAVGLMNAIRKKLNVPLVNSGIETLNAKIKNGRKLKFDEHIYFGGNIIESVVEVGRPKRLDRRLYEIEISFGTGPL